MSAGTKCQIRITRPETPPMRSGPDGTNLDSPGRRSRVLAEAGQVLVEVVEALVVLFGRVHLRVEPLEQDRLGLVDLLLVVGVAGIEVEILLLDHPPELLYAGTKGRRCVSQLLDRVAERAVCLLVLAVDVAEMVVDIHQLLLRLRNGSLRAQDFLRLCRSVAPAHPVPP